MAFSSNGLGSQWTNFQICSHYKSYLYIYTFFEIVWVIEYNKVSIFCFPIKINFNLCRYFSNTEQSSSRNDTYQHHSISHLTMLLPLQITFKSYIGILLPSWTEVTHSNSFSSIILSILPKVFLIHSNLQNGLSRKLICSWVTEHKTNIICLQFSTLLFNHLNIIKHILITNRKI